MGVTVTLLKLSPAVAESLKAGNAGAFDTSDYEDTEDSLYLEKRWGLTHWLLCGDRTYLGDPPAPPPGLWQRLRRIFANAPPPPQAPERSTSGDENLAKHALMGTCGIEVRELDTGYGPPRLMSPAQVQAISATLDSIPAATIQQRLHQSARDAGLTAPEVFSEGPWYPVSWSEAGIEDDEDLVEAVREFYRDAISEGRWVLTLAA